MPKFKILVTQMVEEIGEFEVEAETVEAARGAAYAIGLYDGVANAATWQPSDYAEKAEMYGVTDEDGNLVWER